MTQPKGSTAARGYGWQHVKERRRWKTIIAHQGALCVRCHRPISADMPWDLDHTSDRTGYLGPAHSRCNRGAGGSKARRVPFKAQQQTGAWAKRRCVICGAEYSPRYPGQRGCSRPCGQVVRAMNRPPSSRQATAPAKKSRPALCPVCTSPVTQTPGRGALRIYCTPECRHKAQLQRATAPRSRDW